MLSEFNCVYGAYRAQSVGVNYHLTPTHSRQGLKLLIRAVSSPLKLCVLCTATPLILWVFLQTLTCCYNKGQMIGVSHAFVNMLLYNTGTEERAGAHLDSPGGTHRSHTGRWHSCKPYLLLENLYVKWIIISMNESVLSLVQSISTNVWKHFTTTGIYYFIWRNLEQNLSLDRNSLILFTIRYLNVAKHKQDV